MVTLFLFKIPPVSVAVSAMTITLKQADKSLQLLQMFTVVPI
jgi:hypothetical protein